MIVARLHAQRKKGNGRSWRRVRGAQLAAALYQGPLVRAGPRFAPGRLTCSRAPLAPSQRRRRCPCARRGPRPRGAGSRSPRAGRLPEDLGEIDQRVAAEVQAVRAAGELDRLAGERFGLVQAADRAERERSRLAASRAPVDVDQRRHGFDRLRERERVVVAPLGVYCVSEFRLGGRAQPAIRPTCRGRSRTSRSIRSASSKSVANIASCAASRPDMSYPVVEPKLGERRRPLPSVLVPRPRRPSMPSRSARNTVGERLERPIGTGAEHDLLDPPPRDAGRRRPPAHRPAEAGAGFELVRPDAGAPRVADRPLRRAAHLVGVPGCPLGDDRG